VGALTTLAAAIPGIVDLSGIPNESRAHRTALFHLVNGLVVLALFLVSLGIRWPVGSGDARLAWATAIDVLGLLAITLQGWLGGELVYKHHIGVLNQAEGADPVTLEAGSTERTYAPGASRRPGAERP
jgi:uncharacterized membrane protein